MKFKGFKQTISDIVILPARRRAGIGGFLEHSRPGGAQRRVSVVRAEGILQCTDDHNFDIIYTFRYEFGDITLPGPTVNVPSGFAVNEDFGYTAIPIGQ